MFERTQSRLVLFLVNFSVARKLIINGGAIRPTGLLFGCVVVDRSLFCFVFCSEVKGRATGIVYSPPLDVDIYIYILIYPSGIDVHACPARF